MTIGGIAARPQRNRQGLWISVPTTNPIESTFATVRLTAVSPDHTAVRQPEPLVRETEA
jgi:hypothetical protein